MNERHLELCSSAEWAKTVQRWIIPWVLDDVALGDDVLELGPGPGRTTEVLVQMTPRLTAVEAELTSYRQPDGTWVPLLSLSQSARERLDGSMSQLLEELAPAERAAFLLREVFGYDYNEIAHMLDPRGVGGEARVAANQTDGAVHLEELLLDVELRSVGLRVGAAERYMAAYEQITGETFVPETSAPLARIAKNLGLGSVG